MSFKTVQRRALVNAAIKINSYIKRHEFPDQMNYHRLHFIGCLYFVQWTFCIGFRLYSAFLFFSVLSTAAVPGYPGECTHSIRYSWLAWCSDVVSKFKEHGPRDTTFLLGVRLIGFVKQTDESASRMPAEIRDTQCAYSVQRGRVCCVMPLPRRTKRTFLPEEGLGQIRIYFPVTRDILKEFMIRKVVYKSGLYL
jgi:hypothetical protein